MLIVISPNFHCTRINRWKLMSNIQTMNKWISVQWTLSIQFLNKIMRQCNPQCFSPLDGIQLLTAAIKCRACTESYYTLKLQHVFVRIKIFQMCKFSLLQLVICYSPIYCDSIPLRQMTNVFSNNCLLEVCVCLTFNIRWKCTQLFNIFQL